MVEDGKKKSRIEEKKKIKTGEKTWRGNDKWKKNSRMGLLVGYKRMKGIEVESFYEERTKKYEVETVKPCS